MADEPRKPEADQIQLAKEVLAGERMITASEPRMADDDKPVSSMPEDKKREALELGKKLTADGMKKDLAPLPENASAKERHGAPSDYELARMSNTPAPAPTPAPTPSPTPEPGG